MLIQKNVIAIFLDPYRLGLVAVSSTHELEDYQSRTCAGHLLNRIPEKAPVQPSCPAPILLDMNQTLLIRLLIRAIISP